MSKQKITTTSLKSFNRNASINHRMTDTELLGFYIKQRKSGPFFYLDYHTLSGKRTLSIGKYPTVTAEQARTLVKQYLGRIASGEDVRQTIEKEKTRIKDARQLTVKSYLEVIYQTTLNRQKSGIHTRQALEKHLINWMDKEIHNIDARDIHKWQIEMESKSLSFDRIKGVFNMLKTMLNHAVKNGFIESHKLNGVKLEKPKLSQEAIDSSNTRNYLTKDQITQFFSALETYQENKRQERRNSRRHGKDYLPDLDTFDYVDHVKPWLLFMFYTGFRPGDIFGLQWEHLNFNNNTIRKTIEKIAHHCPKPKIFPIAKPLINILKIWRTQQGNPESGLVFKNPKTHKRFDKAAMQKPWKKIRCLAKLPDELVLYTLRHNFASHLIMNGSDLLTVSKLMSHENIQTTIQNYAHLQPNRDKEIVDQFANMLPFQE